MTSDKRYNRRSFLKGTGIAAAATAVSWRASRAGEPDPAIVNLPDHSKYLGEGVQAHPYGSPSQYEANVIRRDVEWLTATRESSVNFTPIHDLDGIITPNGLAFERHHAGVAEIDPAQHRLMINGLVEKPLVFTMDDVKRFPRENRVYLLECAANSGMEWRGAQLNGCQFTDGMIHTLMYTGVPLKYVRETKPAWMGKRMRAIGFLLRLAAPMALVPGAGRTADIALGEYLAAECVTCHQLSGHSTGGIPSIVGMAEGLFIEALTAYKRGERDNDVMRNIAGRLSLEDMAALAAYFAAQGPRR